MAVKRTNTGHPVLVQRPLTAAVRKDRQVQEGLCRDSQEGAVQALARGGLFLTAVPGTGAQRVLSWPAWGRAPPSPVQRS